MIQKMLNHTAYWPRSNVYPNTYEGLSTSEITSPELNEEQALLQPSLLGLENIHGQHKIVLWVLGALALLIIVGVVK